MHLRDLTCADNKFAATLVSFVLFAEVKVAPIIIVANIRLLFSVRTALRVFHVDRDVTINRQTLLLGFSLVLIMSPYSVPIAAVLSDFSAARRLGRQLTSQMT